MPKIVDYTLLCARDDIALVRQVKTAISSGWQPQGGVVHVPNYSDVNTSGTYSAFFQTVVKFDA